MTKTDELLIKALIVSFIIFILGCTYSFCITKGSAQIKEDDSLKTESSAPVDCGYDEEYDKLREYQISRRQARLKIMADGALKHEKVVFLTIDDGPSEITPGFLDVLKENGVAATFCVIGNRAAWYRDILKRIHDEGHSIINHSYDHNMNEIYRSPQLFLNSIESCSNIIDSIVQRTAAEKSFIRFPGGSDNVYMKANRKDIVSLVKSKGYKTLEWNASSGDCTTGKATVEYITANSTDDKNRDMVVVLMHDFKYRQTTLQALPRIIRHYKDKGYTFKTIEDITPQEMDKLKSKKIVNKLY